MALVSLRLGSGISLRSVPALALGIALLTACTGGRADTGDGGDTSANEPLLARGTKDRVVLEIVAGETPENSYWNLNGFHGGEGRVQVPLGSEVEVDFRNADPAMSHSIGVTRWQDPFPANFAPVKPAFPGASIPGPGSEEQATPPEGQSAFRFRATEAGDFAIVCFMPGHAAVGMYIRLEVVEGLAEASLEP